MSDNVQSKKKNLVIVGIIIAIAIITIIAIIIGNSINAIQGKENNKQVANTMQENELDNTSNTTEENNVNTVNSNTVDENSVNAVSSGNTTVAENLPEEGQNPVATMKIKDYGTIKIELYPDIAPNTVKNFIALANNGFYNGLIFHRVVEDFVIQGGDQKGNGTGNATLSAINSSIKKGSDADKEYCIPGEFEINGYTKNTLSHKKGVISMARADYSSYGLGDEVAKKGYDSASSQFFIMTDDNPSLDKKYAAFGEVISGMEIVEKIEKIEVDVNDRPLNPPVIESVSVETYGVDYGNPETLEEFDLNSYLYGTNR